MRFFRDYRHRMVLPILCMAAAVLAALVNCLEHKTASSFVGLLPAALILFNMRNTTQEEWDKMAQSKGKMLCWELGLLAVFVLFIGLAIFLVLA